jgi:ribosomal protein S18 acetylase RimI-like enzyme
MAAEAGRLEFKDAGVGDDGFLFALYCDVRGPEVEAWGWPAAQRDSFLRMQWMAQSRSYAAAYPDATHQIICEDSVPIGRRLVARGSGGMHLVDIALLASHRNRGLGTMLIQQLIDECRLQKQALDLQVLRGNPAQRLYERLGFKETASDPMYIQMQWTPPAA